MLERSLVILKPDAYLRRFIGAQVLKEFKSEKDLKIIAFKEVKATVNLAEKHYSVHKNKPFFRKLVDYLTLSPVVVMIIEGEGAINKIRSMLGSTFSHKASPDTIRGRYGIWNGINVVHASDAVATSNFEIELWMKEAGLEVKPVGEVDESVISYINKWSGRKVNYTSQLREVCRAATEKKEYDKRIVSEELFKYLKAECYDSSEGEVKRFVEVILDSLT